MLTIMGWMVVNVTMVMTVEAVAVVMKVTAAAEGTTVEVSMVAMEVTTTAEVITSEVIITRVFTTQVFITSVFIMSVFTTPVFIMSVFMSDTTAEPTTKAGVTIILGVTMVVVGALGSVAEAVFEGRSSSLQGRGIL